MNVLIVVLGCRLFDLLGDRQFLILPGFLSRAACRELAAESCFCRFFSLRSFVFNVARLRIVKGHAVVCRSLFSVRYHMYMCSIFFMLG